MPDCSAVLDDATRDSTMETREEATRRSFSMPRLSPSQENAVKAAIMFSPTIDDADKNVTSFLSIVDGELYNDDCVEDFSTFFHKYLFVGTLFRVRKYAACDPPGSTELEKMIRTYQGLLQVVIDMKWR